MMIDAGRAVIQKNAFTKEAIDTSPTDVRMNTSTVVDTSRIVVRRNFDEGTYRHESHRRKEERFH
ncbi:hypothetical protein LSAT2_006037, partial [Lamellibrachia satsuma]